jgi:SAM-dependent methyltransferase
VTERSYTEDLDRALAFSGLSHEFFAQAKAQELLRLARTHVGDPAELNALDAGCGIGLTDERLGGWFRSLIGTDISADALERAKQRNPGVRYELAEPGRLPLENDAVDLAFAATVVQVIPPPERQRFVDELARVTRPGGLVALIEHNPLNLLTRLVSRRFDSPDEIRMLRMGEAQRLLREADLTLIDSGFMLLFPTRRRRVVQIERAVRRLPLGSEYYVAARPG